MKQRSARGGEVAAERGRKLGELGDTLGSRVMRARGERLWGRALASAADARPHLEAAVSAFVRLEMPFEAARTRLLLAQSLREPDPEVAEAEARAALGAFENLGANGDARAAAALLREIETKMRKQTSEASGLSQREAEVLRLVAHGMSNKQIADRLVLSKHSVHRHVSSILTKLDPPIPSRRRCVRRPARLALSTASTIDSIAQIGYIPSSDKNGPSGRSWTSSGLAIVQIKSRSSDRLGRRVRRKCMSTEENKAVGRRELEELYDEGGNLDAAEEIYTPD